MKLTLISTLLLFTATLFGQEINDSIQQKDQGELSYMFYVDTYYGYDFNKPYNGDRPVFLYNYNRDNEFNINLGVANFNYKNEKLEANLGFNVGTFPQSYYAGADTLLNLIYQANIKYIASEKFDVSVGMFAPHLGFESILSFDNMTVSQSLVSEGTPYYIAGVKAYFHPTERWNLGVVIANGWQNLYKQAGARNNGFGLQANYAVANKIELNYSNYVFNDSQTDQWTFYNEVYVQKWFSKKWRATAGASVATIDSDDYVAILTGITQYKLNKKWAIAGRVEYVNDQSLAFYSSDTPSNPFELGAYSANIDWSPIEQLKFRLEGRVFSSAEKMFRNDRNYNPDVPTDIAYSDNNANILFSVQVKID